MRYLIYNLLFLLPSLIFASSGGLEFDILVDPVSCYGEQNGKITINVNSNSSKFTYVLFDNAPWKGGQEILRSEPMSSNTYTFNNLPAGKYCIAAEDDKGNGNMKTALVKQPELFKKIGIEATEIQTGIILNAKVSGGVQPYSYQWSPINKESHEIKIHSEGTYTCKVDDANMCGPFELKYYYYNNLIKKVIHSITGK